MKMSCSEFKKALAFVKPSFSGRLTIADAGSVWIWFSLIFGVFYGIAIAIVAGVRFVDIRLFASLGGWALAIACAIVVLFAASYQVRRLHDTGHSGWWVLLHLVGLGIFPTMMALGDTVGDNQYGPGSKYNLKTTMSFDDLVGGFNTLLTIKPGRMPRVTRREFNMAFNAMYITMSVVVLMTAITSFLSMGLAMAYPKIFTIMNIYAEYVPLVIYVGMGICMFSLLCRRMHDSGRSNAIPVVLVSTVGLLAIVEKLLPENALKTGLLILIGSVCVISSIITVVYSQADTDDDDNEFGPAPDATRR